MPMYDWDEEKRKRNIADHKVDCTAASGFDWDTAVINVDHREDYGELREVAWGLIGERLYTLVFTRRGETIRLISLRKSSQPEARSYVEARR